MQRIQLKSRPVVTGSSGRIGQLLRAVWGDAAEWRSRAAGAPLADLPKDGALLCLAGVVPGTGDLAQNLAIAETTVRAAERAGLSRVLLMSSSAVYAAGGPWAEGDADPQTPYGAAKLAMEAARSDKVNVCALRLGNVAGADALLGRLTDRAPALHIFADGHGPHRGYVGPITLANLLAQLLDFPDPLPPVLNLCQPGTTSMDALLNAAGRDWTAVPAPVEAIARVEMDVSALGRFVPLDPAQGQAQEVVRQWREVCG